MRPVERLISVTGPAWPELQEAITASAVASKGLSVARAAAEQTLYRLQVTTHSVLGALALECGALWWTTGGCGCSAAGTTESRALSRPPS